MNRLKQYEDLWTVDKNSYYIRMSGEDYYIIDRNNMMLLIEEDDNVYFTLIKIMIEHDVKVIDYDLETGNKINLSKQDAIKKLEAFLSRKVKVSIIWKKDMSISKQLLELKKISKNLFSTSITQLMKQIDIKTDEWIFCELLRKDANELKNMAVCKGIKLKIKE